MVLVYPPVEWEGIFDAINRLPVNVVERKSTVAQGHRVTERLKDCIDQRVDMYCTTTLIHSKG